MSRPAAWQPAEWEPHAAVWLAWPADQNLWQEHLEPARREFIQLCEAIADCDPDSGHPRGEALRILAKGDEGLASAKRALAPFGAGIIPADYGDIWLRDTAPIFLRTDSGKLRTARFRFNGWGGKYRLAGDTEVAARIAEVAGVPGEHYGLVFEGGAIDVDGAGTAITTRECLLNPNRNPEHTADEIGDLLKRALGLRKIIWLDRGLLNDHTDGHLDNVARFIGPGKVACMRPTGEDDPNAGVYQAIRQTLDHATDADGQPLEVVEIPSPGRVLDEEGEVIPASHLNFYIANTRVIVPHYGTVPRDELCGALAPHFPNREIVALPAPAILTGGGSFHCITQQQPACA